MKSRHGRSVLAVLTFLAVVMLTSSPSAYAADVCAAAASQAVITLYYDASSGICKESSVEADHTASPTPAATTVIVDLNHCVIFKTSDNSAFDVQFEPGTSPFYDFSASAGNTVSAGPVQGKSNQPYYYSSVTIGGSPCLNGRSLGMVMR